MQFKPEITTGTLLTMLSMAVALFAAWSDVKSDMAKQGVEIVNLKVTDTDIKVAIKESNEKLEKRLDSIYIELREMRREQTRSK